MSDPLRLHPLGEHAALVRDRLTALTSAELVVMTPEDLAELIKRRCGNRRLSPHPRPTARADRRALPTDRPREPGPDVARASRPFAAAARRARRGRYRVPVADRERRAQRHG
jgi:hypothetical protein